MNEKRTVKRKLCKVCGNYKYVHYFYAKKDDDSVIMDKCRICTNALRRLKRKRESLKNGYLGLTGILDEDFVEMFKFLKSIGYDLNKDIHIQFCEKHNLEPKKYDGIARRFTPKELGLT